MDPYEGKFIRYPGSNRTAVAVKDIQLSTDFELTKDQYEIIQQGIWYSFLLISLKY